MSFWWWVRAVSRWVLTTGYAMAITSLSLTPNRTLRRFMKSWEFPERDKVLHFLMYGALTVLLIWALRLRVVRGRKGLMVALACGAYGLAVEIMQMLFLSGDRAFSLGDALANLVGALCAVALLSSLAGTRRDVARLPGSSE